MIDEIALVKDLQTPSLKEIAFRKLIRTYKERLYWHIRKIVITHEDTDDVLQNTFIKVFKNIEETIRCRSTARKFKLYLRLNR